MSTSFLSLALCIMEQLKGPSKSSGKTVIISMRNMVVFWRKDTKMLRIS